MGRTDKETLRETVCRQGIYLTQLFEMLFEDGHTPGHGYQEQHEEQAYANVGHNHAKKKVHYRNHQRHAQKYGPTGALKTQVYQHLHYEHGCCIGRLLLL